MADWGNVQQGLVTGYQIGRSTGGGRLGTLGANIKMVADELRRQDLQQEEIGNKVLGTVVTKQLEKQLDPYAQVKKDLYEKASKGEGARLKGISAEGQPIIDIPDTKETMQADLLNRWSQGEPLTIEQKRLIGVAVSPMEALMDATMNSGTISNPPPKPKLTAKIPKQEATGNNQPEATGKVMVVSPDGRKGYIPASQLNDALSQGYKRSF